MILDIAAITGPVLVVAPHPDDETLGCGGLIALLCERAVRVHTVFVTDGGASHLGSRKWPRARLAKQRETEAAAALASLGAQEQPRSFMRLADAAMPSPGSAEYEAALHTATRLIAGISPSHIVLPWRRDPHCDHQDSFRLFKAACDMASNVSPMLEYTIWLDEFGKTGDFPKQGEVKALELDIGSVLGRKRKAIAEHRSQLGELIDDDPNGFCLEPRTLDRLLKPIEVFWLTA